MADINLDRFPDPGLFLLFPDGERVDLTRASIELTRQLYLGDPARIPPEVRAATDYQPCAICPKRDTAEVCHAIMVVFPFLEDLDRHMSYDRVTAVYRGPDSPLLHVEETTLQRALNFLTMLSLLEYCEQGQLFAEYFRDVTPLMPTEQIARQVFLSLYLKHRGDAKAVREVIGRMQASLHVTTECQVKRIRLICRNDALANAFVNLHTAVTWLSFELQSRLRQIG